MLCAEIYYLSNLRAHILRMKNEEAKQEDEYEYEAVGFLCHLSHFYSYLVSTHHPKHINR